MAIYLQVIMINYPARQKSHGNKVMAIDRVDWHYTAEYPNDLAEENSGTHIGMYLAWIINYNLVGELHLEEDAEELQAVRERTMTGKDFLIKLCDTKFWDEDLNEEGLAFTEHYYHDDHHGYFNDYVQTLATSLPSLYNVADSWQNYDLIAPVITKAYQRWKAKQ